MGEDTWCTVPWEDKELFVLRAWALIASATLRVFAPPLPACEVVYVSADFSSVFTRDFHHDSAPNRECSSKLALVRSSLLASIDGL